MPLENSLHGEMHVKYDVRVLGHESRSRPCQAHKVVKYGYAEVKTKSHQDVSDAVKGVVGVDGLNLRSVGRVSC